METIEINKETLLRICKLLESVLKFMKRVGKLTEASEITEILKNIKEGK